MTLLGEPSSGSALPTIATVGGTWVNVERPTEAEVEHLTRQYSLLRSDLETSLDRGGPAGLWERPNHAVVTLQIPVTGTTKQGVGRTSSPIALFIGSGFVVTVHMGEIRQLNRLFRQFETDEPSRADAFAGGASGVVFAIMQRLIDATAASRANVERAIEVQEENASRATASRSSSRETVLNAARLRADARAIHRLAAPLPQVVRSLAGLDGRDQPAREGWDRLLARVERLALAAEQDLAAIEEIILDAAAVAQFESARSLRILAVVASLTLPVVTVLALLALPASNPLSGLPNAFPVAVAIAGAVFLVALYGLRRRGLV
jgi:magnesium transporter